MSQDVLFRVRSKRIYESASSTVKTISVINKSLESALERVEQGPGLLFGALKRLKPSNFELWALPLQSTGQCQLGVFGLTMCLWASVCS